MVWMTFAHVCACLSQSSAPVINPEADEIDQDAFKDAYLLSKSYYFDVDSMHAVIHRL